MSSRPTISSARFARPFALLVFTAVCATAAPPQPDLAQVEALVVEGTNRFRDSQSRHALHTNAQLEKAARSFAEYLARTRQFDHEAGGTTPASRAKAAGYDYCFVAENIARHRTNMGFATQDLAHRLVEGWKNSPGHRRNMLEPDVIETGVATVHRREDGIDDYYSVQLFGRPRSHSVKFQVRNIGASAARYRLDEKEYDLPPRYSRIHTTCAPAALRFEAPRAASFTTASDQCYVVSRGGDITRAPGGCA
jgi:uncharacterized protein YkwD